MHGQMYTNTQASPDASAAPVTSQAILLPLGTIQIAGVNDFRLQLVGSFRFRRIHFIDLPMEGAAADTEFFGSGRYVALRRG